MDRPDPDDEKYKTVNGPNIFQYHVDCVEWMDWADREMRLLKKQLNDTQELLDEAQTSG